MNYFLFVVISLLTFTSYSQDNVILVSYRHTPIFPGCEKAFDKKRCTTKQVHEFYKKSISPTTLVNIRKTLLYIEIDKNGYATLKNYKPKTINKDAIKELQIVTTKLPKMEPSMNYGKPTKINFILSIEDLLK